MPLGFYSIIFCKLGIVSFILVTSLTWPSFNGTLKSTLIKTLDYWSYERIWFNPILDNISKLIIDLKYYII